MAAAPVPEKREVAAAAVVAAVAVVAERR